MGNTSLDQFGDCLLHKLTKGEEEFDEFPCPSNSIEEIPCCSQSVAMPEPEEEYQNECVGDSWRPKPTMEHITFHPDCEVVASRNAAEKFEHKFEFASTTLCATPCCVPGSHVDVAEWVVFPLSDIPNSLEVRSPNGQHACTGV